MAGKAGGRKLASPADLNVRPMMEVVRGAVFNILQVGFLRHAWVLCPYLSSIAFVKSDLSCWMFSGLGTRWMFSTPATWSVVGPLQRYRICWDRGTKQGL